MKKFGLAIQTMTRLPLKKQFDVTCQDYADSVAWFPATSLMAGAVMLAVYQLILLTGIPYLPAFLCVMAGIMFTGGLHIDGFADVCDAFFAGKTKERTLEILKDSRMGTYGVLGIVFIVVAKTFLIADLNPDRVLWVLLATPLCGKIPLVFCAKLSRYPRQDGMAKCIIENLKIDTALIAIIICSVAVFLVGGFAAGSIAVACMIAIGAVMYFISEKKIDGATGDVLGACNELGEIVFLLVMAVML
ncbi:MAG: adenosylcobinamide-GDP ribazoletransferase [Christensenella sp.]|uniref:adenosylcobinamide-GDP ribazoletransferase n=1 Tax=Christensenella sp. TaxID=1935934 RepID=UPI002B1F188F|nr:adenosylcobinamide-GDP ribazoletransferase [Christensenella sp.]MEA5004215.1 adenosylcobinamide-GDP ribazoletransferase [Christensenella sp.]